MKDKDEERWKQWDEGLAIIACSIFAGAFSYKEDFLDHKPDAKEKEYVDSILRNRLRREYKVIPGFND